MSGFAPLLPPPTKRRRDNEDVRWPPRPSLHPQLQQVQQSLHPQLQLHPQLASEPFTPPELAPQPSTVAMELPTQHHSQNPQLLRPKAQPRPAAASASAIQYQAECILGKGSFGTVYKATVVGTGRLVAIKAVKFRDAGRELKALQMLRGECPNIVSLLGTFVGAEVRDEDRTLNLVLEFVPDTLQRIIKHHRQCCIWMDIYYVRLYKYQILRGLACLGRRGIVHRDIKPANLLVDAATLTLKICDFGTAKLLAEAEANQPYVCSRYYRAPELILSCVDYNIAVDIWSSGCVLAEMLVGQPLFAGKDGVDQLKQIIDIKGTPTPVELYAMSPQYDAGVGFGPPIEARSWETVLGHRVAPEVVELVGRLLQYDPAARPQPLEAMASMFFDELRRGAAQLDPSLFAFSAGEMVGCPPTVRERLIPFGQTGLPGMLPLSVQDRR